MSAITPPETAKAIDLQERSFMQQTLSNKNHKNLIGNCTIDVTQPSIQDAMNRIKHNKFLQKEKDLLM